MKKPLFFTNLTPHDIRVSTGKEVKVFPASGLVARLSTETLDMGTLTDMPLAVTRFGAVNGLPRLEIDEDGHVTKFYIVSLPVYLANEDRPDLLCPDTGNAAIRDDDGHVVGTRRLLANPSLQNHHPEYRKDLEPK